MPALYKTLLYASDKNVVVKNYFLGITPDISIVWPVSCKQMVEDRGKHFC
jgi:hypothetical protein